MAAELEKLRAAPVSVLLARYQELFGECPPGRNKVCLFRRIAWRLQANQYGGLPERARQRALEIAAESDLRLTAPRSKVSGVSPGVSNRPDRRLPLAGTVLRRHHRGRAIEVKVLAHGFEYQNRWFRSLSGIAEDITGTRWNGYVFFGLAQRKPSRAA
jgi:hypothetical protein